MIRSINFNVISCSQTKFVAIILVLSFLSAIFRPTHLTFRPQNRNKQVTPRGHKGLLEPYALPVTKIAIHQNCFEATISWCEGQFLIFKV